MESWPSVTGIGAMADSSPSIYSHRFFVRTDGGVTKKTIWIDTIREMKGMDQLRRSSSEFTIVLKTGTTIEASLVGARGRTSDDCNELIAYEADKHNPCSLLGVRTDDDGSETIDMRDLKSIKFLEPVRKDKEGNAMFDKWRFSPFTGEKLVAK